MSSVLSYQNTEFVEAEEGSFAFVLDYICPMNDLRIAIVQPDLRWEDRKANLQRLETLIRSIDGSPNLVIIPEMFTTGFSMRPAPLAETMDGPTVDWMRRLADEMRITLAGSLIVEEDGGYRNRLVWMPPDGEEFTYDKRHLFRLAGEHERYTPGVRRLVVGLEGWRVNLNICYDLRFPVWSRQNPGLEGPEYDLLVYVANWPESRSHAWRTLLPARAIENQCYVVGVNRVGRDGLGLEHIGESMVVDPLGRMLYLAPPVETVHTQVLDRGILDEHRSRFPFWRDADPFRIG